MHGTEENTLQKTVWEVEDRRQINAKESWRRELIICIAGRRIFLRCRTCSMRLWQEANTRVAEASDI
jgi:hypothetical protein